MNDKYLHPEIETAPRQRLQQIQFQGLKKTLNAAFKTDFYKKRFHKTGFCSTEEIKSLDDIQKIPFTEKDDLRQSFPKGLLAVESTRIVRIHSSSGTTGIPTVIYFSSEDLNRWTDLVARSVYATGARKSDVFQNMMSYGLFTGGLGLHYGAERVGMTIIPVGGGNTKRQLQLMKDFRTTVLHITPSYLLHIHEKMKELGFSLSDLNIKKAFIGAEPHSENTRLKLEDLYNIDAYNSYGLSEMNGPGVAFECEHKKGMHIWEDAYIVEIIDPATGKYVPEGQKGEIVLTNLTRMANPVLRYRTRDLAYLITEKCTCGRTHKRLSRILGRTDDMLIINGVNIFPSQIEEVIMQVPEVGTNYQIHIDKAGALDKLTVKVEIYSKMFTGEVTQLDALRKKIAEQLRASITIHPTVELHEPGSLPAFEGKAKRVVDIRPEF